MIRVKICGITRREDLDAAVAAGADAVGFIVGFPSSRRNIPLASALTLVKRVPFLVDSVLVTTSEVIAREPELIASSKPDAIQLYGDADTDSLRRRLGVKLIRPYLVSQDGDPRSAARGFDALLTDTYVEGQFGGTGKTSDFGVCRMVRDQVAPLPVILSGGLNPGNVADAIETVHPYAVDVSSGVESAPGIKDRVKVEEFVRNAKGSVGA